MRRTQTTTVMKAFTVFLSILLAIFVLPDIALADLEVYFLDVGQGDSAIIVCDGKGMIIDGGLPGQSSKIHSYLENDLHLDRLEYVVATHPDNDHIGGLAAAVQFAKVGRIFSPVKQYDSDPFNDLLKYANAQKAKIEIPYDDEPIYLGNATVTFYNCGRERKSFVRNLGDRITSIFKRDEPEEDPENNDISLVVKIVYGEKAFLFTGDIEKDAESRLISSGFDLNADVIKIAHHGSKSSSTDAFLDLVNPEYAIISCGKNSYGHPSSDTLNTLQKRSITLYRTDLQGDVICTCDGKNITVTSKKDTLYDVFKVSQ